MTGRRAEAAERFDEYLGLLGERIGHADRAGPLRAYLTGLLLSGERKSVEPMAAKVDPHHVSMRHQSMHHFVANAPWDERAVIAVAREYALAQLERHGPVAAWVVDDSGFPKKGTHSVGVARQYCGPMGKQDNCQVAVTLSLVNPSMSVPCAYRLYLPKAWSEDRERRRAAAIPDEIGFQTKPELALAQVDDLLAADLPRAPVVADAGYGSATRRSFARALPRAACPTRLASCGKLPCGRRATVPCRRHAPVAVADRLRAYAVIPLISRLQSAPWREV